MAHYPWSKNLVDFIEERHSISSGLSSGLGSGLGTAGSGALLVRELEALVKAWPTLSRQALIDWMSRLVPDAGLPPSSHAQRGETSVADVIISLAALENREVPPALLDLGSGLDAATVEQLAPLADLFQSPATPIALQELEPESIDVVVLIGVLHHLHPEDRVAIVSGLARVLAPGGIVIIRDHANDQSTKLYCELDLLQVYYFISEGRPFQAMHLMTPGQLRQLFMDQGWAETFTAESPGSWQRLYWVSFQRGALADATTQRLDPVIAVDNRPKVYGYFGSADYWAVREQQQQIGAQWQCLSDLLLQQGDWWRNPATPRLRYHSNYRRLFKGVIPVGWGQLKLLLNELEVLLRWYRGGGAQIVYAGAAPGHHIAILAAMFPLIEWHLYDPEPIDLEASPRIHTYRQTFEIADAAAWAPRVEVSQVPVYFISDVRRKGYQAVEEGRITREELFRSIEEDMLFQQQWTETMRPDLAVLKLRLPYVYETSTDSDRFTNYLDGVVMKQVYNGHSSTELRLVVARPPTDQAYPTVVYDNEAIQDMIFYHNAVVRQSARYVNPLSPLNGSPAPQGSLSPLNGSPDQPCQPGVSITGDSWSTRAIDDTMGLLNDYDSVYFVYLCQQFLATVAAAGDNAGSWVDPLGDSDVLGLARWICHQLAVYRHKGIEKKKGHVVNSPLVSIAGFRVDGGGDE
jgi:SAM-dependent methyltransferase